MIVAELNLIGVAILPPEADAPLIIDPKTIQLFHLAPFLLQPVARRVTQVVDIDCGVDLLQPQSRPFLQRYIDSPDHHAGEDRRVGFIGEPLDFNL